MTKLITKECVLCLEPFQVPYYQRNAVATCGKECYVRRASLMHMKGKYYLCDMCDKPIYLTKSHLKNHNFCSVECDHKYRREVTSLGASKRDSQKPKKKYYGKDWYRIANRVRDLQSRECADCGIHEDRYGKLLSVHHIKPFVTFNTPEEANKVSNLVAVCEPCHRVRHSGEGHVAKIDPNDLGDNSYSGYGTTRANDREKAMKVVHLLLSTDMTLTDISKKVPTSLGTVRRIYHGERWQELYSEPPIHTNPRGKSKYSKFGKR